MQQKQPRRDIYPPQPLRSTDLPMKEYSKAHILTGLPFASKVLLLGGLLNKCPISDL